MKKRRIVAFSILTLVVLLGVIMFSAFFVQPPEKYYALSVSSVNEECLVGQEFEVTASIKNKSLVSSRVIRGFNFIYINMYPAGNEDRVDVPAIAVSDMFWAFENKTETVKFTPQQAGEYSIEIYGSFSIRDKSYKFFQVKHIHAV